MNIQHSSCAAVGSFVHLDADSGLELQLYQGGGGDFFYPWPSYHNKVRVTSRTLSNYNVEDFAPQPGKQYVEIGAGLGAFTPWLVERLEDASPLPIVIDPAPYPDMLRMICQVKRRLRGTMRETAVELERRARILLDPRKVQLYRKTLFRATGDHPELRHCADMIVDNVGAITWGDVTEVQSEYDLMNAYRLLAKRAATLRASDMSHVSHLFPRDLVLSTLTEQDLYI
jgi:hypothetical protein